MSHCMPYCQRPVVSAAARYGRYVVLYFALLALAAGCGKNSNGGLSPKDALAAGDEKNASGSQSQIVSTAANPVILSAQDNNKWETIFERSTPADQAAPTDFVVPQGVQINDNGTLFSAQWDDPAGYLVFGLTDRSIEAATCKALRFRAYGHTGIAGIWWARDSDLKPGAYPFGLDRFAPATSQADGVLELDLANAPEWTGNIRMIRVDLYAAPGVMIPITRIEGLLDAAKTDTFFVQADALTPASVTPPDDATRNLGLLLRAAVVRTKESFDNVRDLEDVLLSLLKSAPASARDRLVDVATAFLQQGDTVHAMNALTIAGLRSGSPEDALQKMLTNLPDDQKAKLWPDGQPFINLVYNGDLEIWNTSDNEPIGFNPPYKTGAKSLIALETTAIATGTKAVKQTWQVADSADSFFRLFSFWLTDLKPKTNYNLSVKAKNMTQKPMPVWTYQYAVKDPANAPAAPPAKRLGRIEITPDGEFKTYSFTFTTQDDKEFCVLVFTCCGANATFPVDVIWDDWRVTEEK